MHGLHLPHRESEGTTGHDGKRPREEKLRQRCWTSAAVTHALSACGRHGPLFEQCKLHLVQMFSKSGLPFVFRFSPSSRRLFFFFLVIKCTLLQQRVIAFDFEIDDATSPVRESNINHSQSYHIRGQTSFGTIDFFLLFFLLSSAVLLTPQMLRLHTNLYSHELNWKRSFNESFKSRPFRFANLLAVN